MPWHNVVRTSQGAGETLTCPPPPRCAGAARPAASDGEGESDEGSSSSDEEDGPPPEQWQAGAAGDDDPGLFQRRLEDLSEDDFDGSEDDERTQQLALQLK